MRFSISGVIALLGALASTAAAQLEPPSTGGIVALQQELRMLGHNKRVLMIGAHPDDEDTELLTLLVRGMGAEAAYLSLNRGEGGQNLIGPELGEALGLIRTEELLAARRLDGARQFFTRAYDFGYSKTLEETWRFWPRDSVLKDVVQIVREFRPQVIVSIFSGTPRDGHGQHQAAGWVAREAFKLAGNDSLYQELGRGWTPLKLYQSTRFDSAATTLSMEGGALDPSLGQTYRQIAMRGRSFHRSQDMGQLQRIGPSQVRVRLLEDRTGHGDGGLFAGIDTSLAGPSPAGTHTTAPTALDSFAAVVDSLRDRVGSNLSEFLPALHRAGGFLRNGGGFATRPEIQDQMNRLDHAVAIASGAMVDMVVDDDRVIPGQEVKALITAWNPSNDSLNVSVELATSQRWDPPGGQLHFTLPPQGFVSETTSLRVRNDASFSEPYFLEQTRDRGLYRVDQTSPRGRPFEPPEISARFAVSGPGGYLGAITREAGYRINDQAFGERRLPLMVVPRIDVKLDPGTEVWSTDPDAHEFTVTLTHGAKDSTRGSIGLEVPVGWPAVNRQTFEFAAPDERETFRFSIRPPAGLRPGHYEIRAVATDERGRRYDQGVFTVDYPHIRPRSRTQASVATVNVAPLEMARLRRVGYIRGASDMVPEALASVGVPIVLLDRATLERGDLSSFDAIVVGSRAYETDSALVENNGRLLAYARNGGLVIVQYQQQVYFNGHFAPYPLTVGGQQIVLDSVAGTRIGPLIGHDRVTDETAPVRIIDPANPVVNRTNKVGAEDWNGWVQERGLYFAHTWDDHYQPVLEMADPGEAPLRGGLLVAKYGKGTYVYTGLSFFRELPAGVPGAFRLFANLLALGEAAVP